MFADRHYRVISYHDTWISIDPIRGCPYSCTYCVLRHSDSTGKKPNPVVSPEECVEQLLKHRLYRGNAFPVAIGNETDMLHVKNAEYLGALLNHMERIELPNPIVLITKAPLSRIDLKPIAKITGLRIIFFLSYSGLGEKCEPNFVEQELRENFRIAKSYGFPVVHFWRPLLPENTSKPAIQEMLSFVSGVADATVFVGLKLHPDLTRILTADGSLSVPARFRREYGEWLEPQTVEAIYTEAGDICPTYPLYRHSACALATLLARPNHTATVYRKDICPPSQCSATQRGICEGSRRIPCEAEISEILGMLGRVMGFERLDDRVRIKDTVSQEEFAFLLHRLNCPIHVESVKMQNLYRGNIYIGQKAQAEN